MSGKNSLLNPLRSRKQLLIAESELNRAQVIGDMAALTTEVCALAARVQTFSFMASSAAGLLAGFRNEPPATAAKPSWLKNIFTGIEFASNLWLAFRSQRRDRAET